MILTVLTETFTISKLKDYSKVDLSQPFVFTCSTFNTDYVLTKADRFEEALRLLSASGYSIKY